MKNTPHSSTPTALYHGHVQKYVDEARKIKDNGLLNADVKKAMIEAGAKAVKNNEVYKDLKAGHNIYQHSQRTAKKVSEILTKPNFLEIEKEYLKCAPQSFVDCWGNLSNEDKINAIESIRFTHDGVALKGMNGVYNVNKSNAYLSDNEVIKINNYDKIDTLYGDKDPVKNENGQTLFYPEAMYRYNRQNQNIVLSAEMFSDFVKKFANRSPQWGATDEVARIFISALGIDINSASIASEDKGLCLLLLGNREYAGVSPAMFISDDRKSVSLGSAGNKSGRYPIRTIQKL